MSENTFFMIMFSFGTAMGLVTLVYVLKKAFARQGGEIGGWELRGAVPRIAAVMRTTLAEGIRARVASGFALMILISIPLFWLTAEGDGTIKGRVQMFETYSLGLTGFLLAILTILFSCRSLSTEIRSRQIYGLVTKPIPRWQIIAGKWVGVMVLNIALLTLAWTMTYFGTRMMVTSFKKSLQSELQTYGSLTPDQSAAAVEALENVRGVGGKGMKSPIIDVFANVLGRSRDETGDILLRLPEATRVNLRRFDELRRQVLIGRTAVQADVPDLSKMVDETYERLKVDNRLPEGWTERRIRKQIDTELSAQFCRISTGEIRQWTLRGPPPEPGRDHVLSVRLKIRPTSPPTAALIEGMRLEGDTVLCHLGLGNPSKANYQVAEEPIPTETYNEAELTQESVEADGTIILTFINIDPRRIDVIIDLPSGDLEILYRVGSWELALAQAGLATLIPLACLAAFGVCASTFLSFSVGALIVLTLYIISASMGFVADSLAVTDAYAPPEEQRSLTYQVRKTTVESLDWALSVGDLDPIRKLTEGRVVGWQQLWTNTWKYVLLKGMLVMLLAVLIFRRRELAAVIV